MDVLRIENFNLARAFFLLGLLLSQFIGYSTLVYGGVVVAAELSTTEVNENKHNYFITKFKLSTNHLSTDLAVERHSVAVEEVENILLDLAKSLSQPALATHEQRMQLIELSGIELEANSPITPQQPAAFNQMAQFANQDAREIRNSAVELSLAALKNLEASGSQPTEDELTTEQLALLQQISVTQNPFVMMAQHEILLQHARQRWITDTNVRSQIIASIIHLGDLEMCQRQINASLNNACLQPINDSRNLVLRLLPWRPEEVEQLEKLLNSKVALIKEAAAEIFRRAKRLQTTSKESTQESDTSLASRHNPEDETKGQAVIQFLLQLFGTSPK